MLSFHKYHAHRYSWCSKHLVSDSDLSEAPGLSDLVRVSDVARPERKSLLVGHNVGFDRSFFRYLIEILCADGRAYHPGCFVCQRCNEPLEGSMFGVDDEDRILCRDDYSKAYSPICFACKRIIAPMLDTGETVRVVAMGREFHVDCYKCQDCGTQLTDEPEKRCYPMGDLLLCYFCHRDRKKPHRRVEGFAVAGFVNPNLSRLGGRYAGTRPDHNGNYLPQPSNV